MTAETLDVVGIGNAIVDVLSESDDDFIAARDLPKGAMTLIDSHQAEEIYAAMGPARESSGGSVANTVAGIASLGGKAGFIGKVRNDQLGGIFRHDIQSIGVFYDTRPAVSGPPTARCLVLITPDAQRTMCTYLGASVELEPGDLDADLVRSAKITYLEGYLWDAPAAKRAFEEAAEAAHAAGRKVALSLSDPFCVERHRESFRTLVDGHIDILFANETEIRSLYEVDSFDAALQAVRGRCQVAALTRSEKGSVILSGEEVHVVDAWPVPRVVDTTGAGDLYAAGFLHGYARGFGLYDCGRIGAICAAEIISHIGARPETALDALVAHHLKVQGI